MKAYTSKHRFDEARRFNFVGEEMGRPRLDSDANEQAWIVRTDARRRSGDIAEGSPDDGFLVSDEHLLEPVLGLSGWSFTPIPPADRRDIRPELNLARRDPESLPHVIRARGVIRLARQFPAPLDLLRRPISLDPADGTFQAAEIVVQVRFDRPPTDTEFRNNPIQVSFLDETGAPRSVAVIGRGLVNGDWQQIRVPLSAFNAFPRSPQADGQQGLLVTGWEITNLPPRTEIFIDALLVRDGGLPESDFVLRGGDGSVGGAGRIFVDGRRTFLETDWRYSLQPDLPNPPPLQRPGALDVRHLIYIDMFDRPVHAFQDDFLVEPALAGEPTTFRSAKTTQVRVTALAPDALPLPPPPMGGGRLTTDMQGLNLPPRFPPEDPDPCRDRCLFSENVSTGAGYRGKINAHARVEILQAAQGVAPPVIAWARDNAATVAPLIEDAPAGSVSLVVSPEDAARFRIDDLVTIEDEWTRLDPGPNNHRPVLRRLRAIDAAEGRLELFPNPEPLTDNPALLDVGGATARPFLLSRHAAVRRWDGADWLLLGVRYNLRDGIEFAFTGDDFRAGEYWSFTARIIDPDGGARGEIESLVDEPVHGPQRVRAPLALVSWSAEGRTFTDLRARFLPLRDVRDRLIELGARHLSPGAFTVVVGDGVRTFGDIDQNIAEGVTGDEAIQIALLQLGEGGGTIYVRAGDYFLEHPVILQSRSQVRILGDGAATRLRVTGAGGAFHLDACGVRGAVGLELMALEETPEMDTPFGSVPPTDVVIGPVILPPNAPAIRPLRPDDLRVAGGQPDGLVATLGARLRVLPPGFGRVGATIVETLEQLRRRQRTNPGQPLETSAPDELAVLQGLPHGVVTVCDSLNVTLSRLDMVSRAAAGGEGSVAAGVLVTGDCSSIRIEDNNIRAPAGVVAAPYARYLSAATLTAFPRATLFLRDVAVADNRIGPLDGRREGVRIADGTLDGIAITGNRIERFPTGIALEDRAETRRVGVDRMIVRDNQLIDITEVGLSVDADGVDVEANEVRMVTRDPEDDDARRDIALLAGIRVTGTGVRLRDSWVTMPQSAADRRPFELEAGILVGGGVVRGLLMGRAVEDLEVVDARIEGAGPGTLADGIVIAGPQPVYDVRIDRNVIRNLGGAGIRCMGHAAAIGHVSVSENRIEDVARATLTWSAAAVLAVRRLEPRLAGMATVGTRPIDVLRRLLALDTPSPALLDAMLRWLDVATLRGAVVMSLVDDASVSSNTLRGIGTRLTPPGFIDPGAPIQTAGILGLGGSDLAFSTNTIEDVIGVAEPIVFNPPPLQPPGRPPIVDLLDRYRLEPLAPPGAARFAPPERLHEALAGLRERIADVAIAPAGDLAAARAGVRLAIDAVVPRMRLLGGELAMAADRIAESSVPLATAAGDEATRLGVDALRAAVSDAAGVTAPNAESIAMWSVIGAFDRATLGGRDVIAEQANALAERAESLPEAVRNTAPQVVELARAVADAPDDAQLRRRLASNVNRLATAVTAANEPGAPPLDPRQPAPQPGPGPVPPDRGPANPDIEALRDLTVSVTNALAARRGVTLVDRVAEAQDVVLRLIELLESVSPDRATRIRRAFASLSEGRSRLTTARVTSFQNLVREEVAATVDELREAAGDGDPATPADPEQPDADGNLSDATDRREAAQRIGLLSLAAEAVDAKLAEVVAVDALDETFELRLAQTATNELRALSNVDPELNRRAADVDSAIRRALETPDRAERETLRDTARFGLDSLISAPEEAAESGSSHAAIDPERIAALGQLALEIGAIDDAAARAEAIDLFGSNAERISRSLALSPEIATGVRERIAEARLTLGNAAPAGGARGAAIQALASVAETIGREARSAPGAAPETETAAFLAELTHHALNIAVPEADRITAVRDRIAASPASISPSLRSEISAAAALPDLLDGLRSGIGTITRIPPLILVPPPVLNGSRLHPADGVYCGAVAEHLSVDANTVATARIGIAVAGASDHPLAPAEQRSGLIVVERNRVSACPISAFDLRPEGTVGLTVDGNSASACCGAPDPDATAYGQGVMVITGAGELNVVGNRLRDNGNAAAVGLLHEILIDWRGDVTVRGNRIRHAGGARGGAGVLVMTGGMDAALVGRLSREPALVVEPPPRVRRPQIRPAGSGLGNFAAIDPSLFAVSLGMTAMTARTDAFEFGGMTLADAPEPSLHRAFTAGPRPGPDTGPATNAAEAWLQPRVAEPISPLIGFLDRIPVRVVRPVLPPARRSVQVVANDVVASGPALLLLHNGGALVSAGITGNEFESSVVAGAVYLRNVDALVFTGNRCEALREVNVAVLRCGDAAVTASANGVTGREPAIPPPRPMPRPPLRPVGPITPGGSGGLSLRLDLGDGSGLSLPVRPEVLQDSLRRAGTSGAFGAAAEKAEAGFKVYAAENAIDPATRILRGTDLVRIPRPDPARGPRIDAARPTSGVSNEDARNTLGAILVDANLPDTSKLYAAAKFVQLSDPQARSLVAQQLEETGGDPAEALQRGINVLAGNAGSDIGTRVSSTPRSVFEDMLGFALRDQPPQTLLDPGRFRLPPATPPPPPRNEARDRSLVIIGGARVAAVGNATTSGVYVHPGPDRLLFNV